MDVVWDLLGFLWVFDLVKNHEDLWKKNRDFVVKSG